MGNKKLNTKPKQSLRKFYRLKGIRLSKTSKRKNVVPNQDNGVGSDPNINIEGAYSLQSQADEPQSIVVEVPRELTAEELEEIKRAEEREKLKRKLNLLNVDMVGTLESRALRIRPEPIITPVKEKKPKIKRSSSNSKEFPSDALDEKGESPYFEGNLVIDESQFEDEGAAGEPSVETDQPWQPYSGSPSKTNTKRGRPKKPKVPRATTKQEKDKKKRGRPLGSKTQPDPQRSKKPVKPKTSVEFERQRVRLIVVRVYDYLEREYEFLKSSICSNCNLRPLANILKRTAEATGFTENIIDKILKEEKEQKERLQREAELLAEKRKAQRIRSRLQKAAARERIANANKSVNTSVASDNVVVSEVSSDGNSVLPVVETLKVEVFDVEYNDMGPFMGEAFSEPEVMLPQGTITMVPNVAVRTISEPQQWPPEVKVEPLDMDVAESTAVIPTLHPNQPVNADPLAQIPTGDPLKPDPTETAGDPTGTAANPTKKYTPRDPVEADLQETNSAVQILRTLLLRD